MIKVMLFLVKLPPLAKIILAGTASLTVAMAAIFAGAPDMPDLHNIFFFYVVFIACSAIITGMPEPDTELTGWRFFYTWAYRSGHLLVASATAYFMHSKKWQDIGGDRSMDVTSSSSTTVTERHS